MPRTDFTVSDFAGHYRAALPTGRICPACGAEMVISRSEFDRSTRVYCHNPRCQAQAALEKAGVLMPIQAALEAIDHVPEPAVQWARVFASENQWTNSLAMAPGAEVRTSLPQ